MQTSHSFINIYKLRLTSLDRSIQSNNSRQQQQQQSEPRHGQVEYRKLLQRFRQFLAEEEKFWTQFLARYCLSFQLTEAHPALVALGILTTATDGNVIGDPALSNSRVSNCFPQHLPDGRGPHSADDRKSCLSIMSKALTCLGDIARYKELYNESGGRPKAGQEAPARRARGKKQPVGFESLPRPRNFDRAKLCYNQAKLLVPHEGNPSHQLAILASYEKDTFSSLYHYYRSLCVLQPYDPATENIETILSKALDQWKRRDPATKDPAVDAVPKIRIEALKDKTVIFHALWHLKAEK
jgi:protein SMG7